MYVSKTFDRAIFFPSSETSSGFRVGVRVAGRLASGDGLLDVLLSRMDLIQHGGIGRFKGCYTGTARVCQAYLSTRLANGSNRVRGHANYIYVRLEEI